jgi:GH15 family glucan-1,4-alpha-glucosidase
MAMKTGILPEQMHPLTGSPLSVAPLTWSHATYVDTVLKYLEKQKEMSSST